MLFSTNKYAPKSFLMGAGELATPAVPAVPTVPSLPPVNPVALVVGLAIDGFILYGAYKYYTYQKRPRR